MSLGTLSTMLGRCPRCGGSRPLALDGNASPCGSCGYTNLITSSAPPMEAVQEPVWGTALMVCIGVSAVVFALALFAARVASASPTSSLQCVEAEREVTLQCE